MTLSKLLDSLTGRETPPAVPGRRTTPSSSPDLGALMEGSSLRFVPAKEHEHTLGGQLEVRERISEVLPGVTFDDEGRGSFTRNGYSLTFNTGSEDRVQSVRVEVTGGAAAMPPLQRLAAKTGWRLEPAR